MEEAVYFPLTCFQCHDAGCVKVCPTSALIRDEETKVIKLIQEKCVGCKMCLLGCPFGTISFNSKTGKAIKCDTCAGDPECIKYCVTGALEFQEAEDSTQYKKRDVAAKLKETFIS